MNKRVLFALLLIAICVIIMLVNTHTIRLNLIGAMQVTAAFVYLGFLVIGIVIGMLLK